MIVIDFETRSRVDLRKTGQSVYARDYSTEVLCLAYSMTETSEAHTWVKGDPPPVDLFRAIDEGELVMAHNVGFERMIWDHVCEARMGWLGVPSASWRCSLAECCRMGLPRGLAMAGIALQLATQKDDAGHRLMLKMCKPRKPTKNNKNEWHDSPEDMARLVAYCKKDVEAEQAIISAIERLTPSELKVWQLDQKINLRGIPIDREALLAAIRVVEEAYEEECKKLRDITSETLKTPKQVLAMRAYLKAWFGVDLSDLSKATVEEALAGGLPEEARKIIEIRARSSRSSTAKLVSMIERSDSDDRVRGSMVYHGAATGRWAGAGIQIQNFPRGTFSPKEIDIVHHLLHRSRALDLLLAEPMECISNSLRSMIKASDGHRFLVCDFASIEARVLAWVAHEHSLLATFASGGDVYIAMACKIYGIEASEVTKEQRSIGKMAILGLGYGMGHRTFRTACKTMAGVTITNKFAKQVVKAYRGANPNIKALWADLGSVVLRAVETRKPHKCGDLEVTSCGDWLRIGLPSGRKIHYRRPSLIEVQAPWTIGHEGAIIAPESMQDELEELDITLGERQHHKWVDCFLPGNSAKIISSGSVRLDVKQCEPKMIEQLQYWSVDSVSRKWGPNRTYGAKLVENVVQAIARDFLAEAMLRVERAGYKIVATIHDEILSEVREDFGSLDRFTEIMEQVPTWGKGCPIAAEGFDAKRYKK